MHEACLAQCCGQCGDAWNVGYGALLPKRNVAQCFQALGTVRLVLLDAFAVGVAGVVDEIQHVVQASGILWASQIDRPHDCVDLMHLSSAPVSVVCTTALKEFSSQP